MPFDLEDASFSFMMPIILGVITIYLLVVILMILGGANKTTITWRLMGGIALVAISYVYVTHNYPNAIKTPLF